MSVSVVYNSSHTAWRGLKVAAATAPEEFTWKSTELGRGHSTISL